MRKRKGEYEEPTNPTPGELDPREAESCVPMAGAKRRQADWQAGR